MREVTSLSAVALILLGIVVGPLLIPPAAANAVPNVTSITRNGTTIYSGGSYPAWFQDDGFDSSSMFYGPVSFEKPYGSGPTYQSSSSTYTVTVNTAGRTPYLVGAVGEIQSWSYSGGTLTIVVKSVRRYYAGPPSFYYYMVGFMVDFNPDRSYNYGMFCSFDGDTFSMGSPSPGVFEFYVTGESWRSGTTGNVRLFMPADTPAYFGKTLDDVVIRVDRVGVTATTSSFSNAGKSGRLWIFTFGFSSHTISSSANPSKSAVSSVGGHIMPTNGLAILLPYLAMIGLVATAVYVAKRRR